MTQATQTVRYTVTATLPDETVADEYIRWLIQGHMHAVLVAGAQSGSVTRLTEPQTPIVVETSYLFTNMDSFRSYFNGPGVALRAEGMAKFGSGRGVQFARRVGLVLLMA